MHNIDEKTYKENHRNINPFTGIWFRTRETVRYVIDEKPLSYVIMLIVIAGAFGALVGAFDPAREALFPLWGTIVAGLVFGPIAGLLGIAVISAVYLVIGKLFKGISTYEEMFKAIGTTVIPQIWFTPVLLLVYLVAPDLMLMQTGAEPTPFTFVVGGLIAFAGFVITVWGLVIQSKAIGEAHRFSSWKGFFTLLIPAVMLFIFIIVLIALFAVAITNLS